MFTIVTRIMELGNLGQDVLRLEDKLFTGLGGVNAHCRDNCLLRQECEDSTVTETENRQRPLDTMNSRIHWHPL